jgi:hypothetical protein
MASIESLFSAIAVKDDPNLAVAKAAAVITSLLDDTKLTNAQKRRVLDIVAGGYKGKVVGSNQNTGNGYQPAASSEKAKPAPPTQNTERADPGLSSVSKKGQAPPNPVKRHPDFLKMSQQRMAYVEELKKLAPGSASHAAKKKQVSDMEVAMATFKVEHGRKAIPPAVNNAEAKAKAALP